MEDHEDVDSEIDAEQAERERKFHRIYWPFVGAVITSGVLIVNFPSMVLKVSAQWFSFVEQMGWPANEGMLQIVPFLILAGAVNTIYVLLFVDLLAAITQRHK